MEDNNNQLELSIKHVLAEVGNRLLEVEPEQKLDDNPQDLSRKFVQKYSEWQHYESGVRKIIREKRQIFNLSDVSFGIHQ
jgi:hypothetical protein